MTNITENNIHVFEEWNKLEKAMNDAEKIWREAARTATNETEIYPLFQEYLQACEKWKDYRFKHMGILSAQKL